MSPRTRVVPRGAGRRRPAPLLLLLVALLWLPLMPASAAADVRFGQPEASGDFGEVVTFRTTFRSTEAPHRVELLTRLEGDTVEWVEPATVERIGTDAWRATAYRAGHIVPNTGWQFRFRVVTPEGSVTGPSASHRVRDERHTWRVLEGEAVNVWWYEGDDDFGQRALDIAGSALASATALLGVGPMAPVDFFIYGDTRDFREAMGPATRENVGGQAHPAIHTLFGLIEPRQVRSEWVEELITHELVHLVFDEAVENPYAYPPRWLNEGLAVYISKGFTREDEAQVRGAAGGGTIIPLDGLGGNFPTRPLRSSLAYAESVSAVDFFIRTYGEDRLVDLITSFGEGLGTDEAFIVATGEDAAAFDHAWLGSLGARPPRAYGPIEPAP